MIEIKIDMNELSHLTIKGDKTTVPIEMYNLFEAFMRSGAKDIFTSAYLAYLESNEELLNEFLKYHNDDKTKVINDLVDKIFGDNGE